MTTSINDTIQQMADCLPNGRAWAKKNEDDSNIRKLLNSLAVSPNRAQQQIDILENEFNINTTFDMLEDWEESVGIPDQCLGTSETIDERRQAVIDRLGKMPIVTLSQMQAYIDELFPDYGVTLYPGYEYYGFEYEFEVPFFVSASDKFILVAELPSSGNTFEYEFEIDFEGGPDVERLVCLLEKINPASVVVVIEYRRTA